MFGNHKIEFEPKPETGIIYVCNKCGTHLAKYDDRVSKVPKPTPAEQV